jgi:hypothetical protein
MAFNAREFLQNLGKRGGFTRSAHFEVVFTLPPHLASKYNVNDLKFSASTANIPQISLDVTPVRRGGTTYEEFFPVNVSYNPLSIIFLSDGKAQNLSMIKDWLDFIFSIDGNDANSFRVGYRNDYIAPSVTLRHFDGQGKSVIEYTFFDVFPQSIGDVQLNWGSDDQIVTIPVSFRYRYYIQKNLSSTIAKTGTPQPAKTTQLPVKPLVTGGGGFGGGGATGSF